MTGMMPRAGSVRVLKTGIGKLIWSAGQLKHVSATMAITDGDEAGQLA